MFCSSASNVNFEHVIVMPAGLWLVNHKVYSIILKFIIIYNKAELFVSWYTKEIGKKKVILFSEIGRVKIFYQLPARIVDVYCNIYFCL